MHHSAYLRVTWTVDFHPDYADELPGLPPAAAEEIIAAVKLLQQFGPTLGRPNADTLSGSRMKNLKELRFNADNGVWRIAYAFDPKRKGILLCGGDKTGVSSKRFYKSLIAVAEQRYDDHLRRTK